MGTPAKRPRGPKEKSAAQIDQQIDTEYLRKCVHCWYQNLHEETYFCPPLQDSDSEDESESEEKNESESGDSITSEPSSEYQSDTKPDCYVRHNNESQRVLACIQELSKVETQVMMVISQLQFGLYLNKPCYAALLPRPIDLELKCRQGDFDLLIIHKTYGLIIFEIKSVGYNFSELQNEKSKENVILLSKVDEAIKQLNKSNHVIKHLVSDIMPNVNVIKVLVLANVTKDQLSGAMTSNISSTSENFSRCLGVQTLDEAIGLCVLSENLPENDKPWNVTSTIKDRFLQWWHRRVVGRGSHAAMEDEIYEQVVARFCGSATTIFIHCISTPRLELRTVGASVFETGERMSGLVLFPEQVKILNTSKPLVYLTGPPGTGKSVVLMIQGLSWLQCGHDVYVVSLIPESRAASMVIEHQLKKTWSATTPKVYRHWDDYVQNCRKEPAITRLLKHSPHKDDIFCVIVDDAVCNAILDPGSVLKDFCEKLKSQRPNLRLWAAALEHGQRPSCLFEVIFRAPLRSPPVVTKEVEHSGAMKHRHNVYVNRRGESKHCNLEDKRVHTYTTSEVPVPADGPPVVRISHHVDTLGHLGKLPLECAECGRQVAQFLTNLRVGVGSAGNSPPSLQYRDVLVLCERLSTNLGFADGLRENGTPVKVLAYLRGYGDIQELVLAKTDQVMITESESAWGLERKIIIVAGSLRKKMTEDERLRCASRCTSQLVIIN